MDTDPVSQVEGRWSQPLSNEILSLVIREKV